MIRKLIIVTLLIGHFLWANVLAAPITLKAVEQTLIVNNKKAKVFNIIQPNGTEGFIGSKGEYFDVLLKNETTVPISIHWHGLILPNNQDGVPYVTQLPIPPATSHYYHFKILQVGTYWMHSHYKFHEQELMAAPLILKDAHAIDNYNKDITVMLQGFTFKDPKKILYQLQHTKMKSMSPHSTPDLNDVQFDAFLANRRTLSNPEIFEVKSREKIRLRLINASTASNFWIDTGNLKAKAIAVDGNNIQPIYNTRFQLAIAQRIDLEVTIPETGSIFPIFAQVEGTKQRTGIILTKPNTTIPKISEYATIEAPPLDDTQEFQLHSAKQFPIKSINTTLNYKLTGDMMRYIWSINNEIWPRVKPYQIKKNNRIEMVFLNDTGMSHPMHLHGHVFQVTEINGKKLQNGPMRDTILVLPHSTKKIVFDADNPGLWMLHCHVLYHMLAGMMTTTNYANYPQPEYYRKLIKGELKDYN